MKHSYMVTKMSRFAVASSAQSITREPIESLLWADNAEHEVFSFDDSSIDGIVVDEGLTRSTRCPDFHNIFSFFHLFVTTFDLSPKPHQLSGLKVED